MSIGIGYFFNSNATLQAVANLLEWILQRGPHAV